MVLSVIVCLVKIISDNSLNRIMTTTIADRIHAIQNIIKKTKKINQLVRLIGVSKGQTALSINEAFAAGLSDFGENYWQEASQKQSQLKNLPITWHFLGAIQSNKAAFIAAHFDWVHGINREKIIPLLAQNRPTHLPPLNVCIEINLDRETSKSGILPEKITPLICLINQWPTLQLRGFMAIPKPCFTPQEQYISFSRLTNLLENTNQQFKLKMDTLSMGMSDDFQAAILAGSTMVRIGRAIFGERSS